MDRAEPSSASGGQNRAAGSPGVRRVVDADGLDGVLPETDLLVIAAPETPETANLVDRRRLALLPPNAVVVNVGRGSLIDEPA
ncbi:MAG TPA: NAD(P)-dependent oxidoreductase, partial [Candidatus Dormibacteraeota bacterium]